MIVPEEVVGNDLPYNFEIFGKYEVVLYFLTLITVFDTMKKHFHCYFRLNSRQWFKYDGLNTPAVFSVFFPSIPNLQETIGFLVYIKSGYTIENDFSISKKQKISMTIKKKGHKETNTSHLTQQEQYFVFCEFKARNKIKSKARDKIKHQKNVQPLRKAF